MRNQPQSVRTPGPYPIRWDALADRGRIARLHICFNRYFSFLVETNDGLSGAFMERAGCKSFWACRLSIASSLS